MLLVHRVRPLAGVEALEALGVVEGAALEVPEEGEDVFVQDLRREEGAVLLDPRPPVRHVAPLHEPVLPGAQPAVCVLRESQRQQDVLFGEAPLVHRPVRRLHHRDSLLVHLPVPPHLGDGVTVVRRHQHLRRWRRTRGLLRRPHPLQRDVQHRAARVPPRYSLGPPQVLQRHELDAHRLAELRHVRQRGDADGAEVLGRVGSQLRLDVLRGREAGALGVVAAGAAADGWSVETSGCEA